MAHSVDPGSRYILALRNIKENNEDISGFPIKSLANTLRQNAPKLRRYVILDCCFPPLHSESFQSVGPLEVARQKIEDYLPSKGTALLCASGARDPAKAPHDATYTMFSSVLLEILEKGSADLPERFSLADLAARTQDAIQERYADAAVRPQVLSPDQTVGDIAKLAIFPNPGLGVRFLSENIDQLQRTVSNLVGVKEKLSGVRSLLRPASKILAKAVQQVIDLNLKAGEVVNTSSQTTPENSFRSPSTGLTTKQWDELPARIKSQIIQYFKRKRYGRCWLITSILIATATWTVSFTSLVYQFNRLTVIGYALMAVCAFITMLQSRLVERLMPSSAAPASPDYYTTKENPVWENYDIIVAASGQEWRTLGGLEIEKTAYSISHLIYALTFLCTALIRVFSLYPTLLNPSAFR